MHILTLEDRMTPYDHLYQKIASWPAVYARFPFFADTHALSVVDSCRNADGDFLFIRNISVAVAVRTFFLDDLARTAAVRASLDILYHTKQRLLCHNHLAFAAALCAGLRFRTRLCTASVALWTIVF